MGHDGRIALGPDTELERIAARVLPDLVGVDAMPVRPFTGCQEIEDRAAGRAGAVGGCGAPRLGVPAALGVRLHPERLDHLASTRH